MGYSNGYSNGYSQVRRRPSGRPNSPTSEGDIDGARGLDDTGVDVDAGLAAEVPWLIGAGTRRRRREVEGGVIPALVRSVSLQREALALQLSAHARVCVARVCVCVCVCAGLCSGWVVQQGGGGGYEPGSGLHVCVAYVAVAHRLRTNIQRVKQ
jgi:hypothetical protein